MHVHACASQTLYAIIDMPVCVCACVHVHVYIMCELELRACLLKFYLGT